MSSVEAVFGSELTYLSEEEAARRSRLRFVRSKIQLGVFDASRNPTGHVLTAWEAYQAYGLKILEEAVEYGSAILNHPDGLEPVLRHRLEELGLQPSAVARETGLEARIVERAERQRDDNRIGDLERIGFILGLDELQLGYRPTGPVDAELAEPVDSMRHLVETKLGIPVIQTELPDDIAGATIAVDDPERDDVRGIVLNTKGANENVWVRRATLAHELGHLLFDPIQRLERVRVDTYQSNEVDPQVAATDYVEQRANAFAISFLAPMEAVRDMAPAPLEADSVRNVMSTFGISHTAARYHIRNSHYGQYEVPEVMYPAAPSDEQKAAENFALDYFPIQSTPPLRRGKFVEAVTSCLVKGYISEDTAAKYMNCSRTELQDNLPAIIGLSG